MCTAQNYELSARESLSQLLKGLFSQYHVSFRNTYTVEEWYSLFRAEAYLRAAEYGLDEDETEFQHLRGYEFVSFSQHLLAGTEPAYPDVVLISNEVMNVLVDLARGDNQNMPEQHAIAGIVELMIAGHDITSEDIPVETINSTQR